MDVNIWPLLEKRVKKRKHCCHDCKRAQSKAASSPKHIVRRIVGKWGSKTMRNRREMKEDRNSYDNREVVEIQYDPPQDRKPTTKVEKCAKCGGTECFATLNFIFCINSTPYDWNWDNYSVKDNNCDCDWFGPILCWYCEQLYCT